MDSLHNWHTASKRILSETKIFSLEEHIRVEDVSGKQGTFVVIDAPSWINVIAITKEEKFVLVEQFRHGSGQFELEIVGGDAEIGEDPQVAALRELKEETGFTPSPISTIELIGTTKPNPAFMNNTCYTYLVTNAVQSSQPELDEFERIRVQLVSYEELISMVKDGTIDHSLVLNAIFWYRLNVLKV